MVSWTYKLMVAVASATTIVAQSTTAIHAADQARAAEPQFDLAGGDTSHIADIEGMTAAARDNPGTMANLIIANTDNANTFPTQGGKNVAYISCDARDYPGNLQAANVVNIVMKDRRASAVLLFSQVAEAGCVANTTADQSLDALSIYTMIGTRNATDLLSRLQQAANSTTSEFLVSIQRAGPNNQTEPPGGPSPSTAVAMIILYSITGVITALFLIIIMTGAVRAHRHPERYGPRDGAGRPRQSRARGIARAMLDTLPIVKFGEEQASKPNDVELGTSSKQTGTNTGATTEELEVASTVATSTAASAPKKSLENTGGIAPAEAKSTDDVSNREATGLECAICAEEFERGQDVRVLPCDHKFHAGCVDQWLLNVSGTCPLCRIDLRPPEATEDEAVRSPSDAPPLEEDLRRRSALTYIFSSSRTMTRDERIAELRRLRSTNDDVTDGAANDSRRRRLAERLNRTFGIRTRQAEPGRLPEERNPTASGSENNTPATRHEWGPSSTG
ncbi:hypothetical protein EJ05DRAFT_497695 [Pseudovirgaria hyperparasitica]|uniref:RING-type domain-containing protein n=1 Tax=Pseudovirgaria hyperparasitica TaxID=470096 RepID=A0A6A6WHL3_9PEZI|nr:uncharacterized protein EJ05DRAFT_497695 [Pseudovirgaria hyperparasitica]KAF2761137.1 hypothetical protein EJ05DRAFT_497695 [Pseudovirgaria hyperparasitica]